MESEENGKLRQRKSIRGRGKKYGGNEQETEIERGDHTKQVNMNQ